MTSNIRLLIVGWLAAAAMVLGIVGCTSSQGACPAIVAELPSTATPGATVRVLLSELWASCADGGQGAAQSMGRVEVRAVAQSDPKEVVARGSGAVADDATAVVELVLPNDATGVLDIRIGDESVGQLTVTER